MDEIFLQQYTLEEKVSAELVKQLYTQAKAALIGSFLTALCLGVGLYAIIPSPILFGWFALFLLISIARYALIHAYFQSKPSIDTISFWNKCYIAATFASSLVWMLVGTLLFPTDILHQVFIAFGVAGIVAATVPFLSANLFSASIFIVVVLVPFGVNMWLRGDTAHQLVAVLSFIYFCAVMFAASRAYAEIKLALKLKFENDELIQHLYKAKNQTEIINQELKIEVKERKDIENLLRNSEEQYKLVTNALPVLIAYIDRDLYFRFNNKAYAEAFKKPLNEITNQSVKNIFDELAYATFLENYQKVLSGQPVNYETTLILQDDQERYVSVNLIPHLHDNNIQGIFSLISDMTPRINYLATHDVLTGLPNRSLFNARFAHALKHAQRNNKQMALLFLDLDHFKNINDTLGHDVGDLLLIKVAERLRECVGATATIARLGGDEFIIVLPEVNNVEEVISDAKQICLSLENVFRINEKDLFITTSIGISLYPNDGDNMQSLLKNADMSMYRAKDRGRNTFEFYTSGMNETIQRKIQIETHLRNALEQKTLKVFYQPLFDLKYKKISSLEALLRWYHPEMGLIPSSEFIAIAEETGLIIPIGEWVLRTACEHNYRWIKAGYEALRVSVNISPRQFMKHNLAETIERILLETKLPGKYLSLELTETSLMADIEHSIKMIKALKALDIAIAIDDFGMGYSSLSQLKRFPFDLIKIDRAFITDFNLNTDDAAIVKAIIAMAHNLKMKVVAEGVETPEQLAFLEQYGCDEIQGYLFYPPLPEIEAEMLLNKAAHHLPLQPV